MHVLRFCFAAGLLASLLATVPFGVLAAPARQGGPPVDQASLALKLEPVAKGFDRPVFVADPGDGTGRLFVVEQPGRIRILRGGAVDPEPFLDISDLVVTGNNEQGLLGLAFDPAFARSGEFYVAYTANQGEGSGDNTLARYRVSADDRDRADPASAEILLAITDPFPNHNGGMLAFGPDGYLYLGTGDGGAGGDPFGNGQNPDALLGKILRLDVSGGGADRAYAIPPDNPFVDGGGAAEVWAMGVRNPWRYSFDRETGDLWVGDVGQNWIEEIDRIPAGAGGGINLGWNVLEGRSCFAEDDCDPGAYLPPVATYTHDDGCSVTGGYVYRGGSIPALVGRYLFADYCTGSLWLLGQDAAGTWVASEPIETGLNVSSFGEDAAGELYVIDLGGQIFRIAGEEG